MATVVKRDREFARQLYIGDAQTVVADKHNAKIIAQARTEALTEFRLAVAEWAAENADLGGDVSLPGLLEFLGGGL